MRTLVRSLSTVDPHVSSQLAELHCSVLTLRTLVGSLLGVDVLHVSHQLTRGRELCFTITAFFRLYPKMRVEMIEKSLFCFELFRTLRTLVTGQWFGVERSHSSQLYSPSPVICIIFLTKI